MIAYVQDWDVDTCERFTQNLLLHIEIRHLLDVLYQFAISVRDRVAKVHLVIFFSEIVLEGQVVKGDILQIVIHYLVP